MTTCSVSLDDVDLASLPTRNRGNEYLGKEFYEFRVMDTEDDDSSDSELYKCHVCAIEIPSACLNIHNNGAKHQSNVKIAKEATNRMRELLTTNPPTSVQRGERFCDPCAVIASDDHEKTKEHKVAVVHDRMLNELSNLYVGENDGKNDKRNAVTKPKAVDSKETKKVIAKMNVCDNYIETINGNDTAKVTKTKAVANKFTQTTKVDPNVKVNGEENAKRDTEYVKIPMNIYIKILNSIPIAPKIAIKAIGSEILITVDNGKMLVSSDRFHSFYKNGTQLVCLVCNVVVLKPGEKEIHKLAVAHMEAILRVVDDSHCVRPINVTWSHCILCNILVKSTQIQEHNASKSHLEIYKVVSLNTEVWEKLLLMEAEICRPTPEIKYYEPVKQNNANKSPAVKENAKTRNLKPNIEIPKIDKVVLAPKQSLPVKNAGKAKNRSAKVGLEPVKIVSEVHSVFPIDGRIEYPFEPKGQGSVLCTICKCVVPGSIQNMTDHMNGQRHVKNVKMQFPSLSGDW